MGTMWGATIPKTQDKSVPQEKNKNKKGMNIVVVVIPFFLDVRLVDASAGVTQEEGHTVFLHRPSAVLALIFIARSIQPSLSLVDREAEFCVPTK